MKRAVSIGRRSGPAASALSPRSAPYCPEKLVRVTDKIPVSNALRREDENMDVSRALLEKYVLRATIQTDGKRLVIRVFKGRERRTYIAVNDAYRHEIGRFRADIRFFPRRPGTFAGAPVDGREAYTWVRENSGVKVFDRGFQVQPYGEEGDDWLNLVRDAARNERHPQSEVTKKHFPMTKEVHASPKTNWMLRLPELAQLIGAVEVRGRRSKTGAQRGLVAAADREGFVANKAFSQLVDIVRGAIEMMAVADRQNQQEDARKDQEPAETKGGQQQEEIVQSRQTSTLPMPEEPARIGDVCNKAEEVAAPGDLSS